MLLRYREVHDAYMRPNSDHDPSKVFHRKVNKRILPDYYDVIKEPMALSTLKVRQILKAAHLDAIIHWPTAYRITAKICNKGIQIILGIRTRLRLGT